MTGFPDINIQDRNEKDEYIVLACDGIWDVFSNEVFSFHICIHVESNAIFEGRNLQGEVLCR